LSGGKTKKKWHHKCKVALRFLAESVGLEPSEYEIRSSMGGASIAGDIILHTEHCYIQICAGSSVQDIMYRKCRGREDYNGLENNWCSLSDAIPLLCIFLSNAHGEQPEQAPQTPVQQGLLDKYPTSPKNAGHDI